MNGIERGIIVRRLLDAWMNADTPLTLHPKGWWVERFRRLGYSADGVVDESLRPAGNTVLCRGSVPEARGGLAWTPDLALGEWFANRCGGEVWVCEFPPSALLAHLGPAYGDQQISDASEFIADPTGLDIVPLSAIPSTAVSA